MIGLGRIEAAAFDPGRDRRLEEMCAGAEPGDEGRGETRLRGDCGKIAER